MICIGKVTNTHGIKGEIRILSNFKYKTEIFQKNNNIYINDEKLIIKTYRTHKKYDMLMLDGYNDINEVLKFKGLKVYIDEHEYNFSGVLNESLIGLKVYNDNKYIGTILNVEENAGKELLVIKNNDKEFLIPYVDEFVKNISKDKMEVKLIKGFIDEN